MVIHAEVIGIAYLNERGLLARNRIPDEVRAECKRLASEIEGKLNDTSSNWTNKVTWRGQTELTGSWRNLPRESMLITVQPMGTDQAVKIWTWIDEGTKPHVIRARRAPRLKFRANYSPRTRPRTFASGQARRSGPWRSPKEVMHPGTEARNWKEEILDEYARGLGDRIQGAINQGTRGLF